MVTTPDAGDAIVVETITVTTSPETTVTATEWHFNLSRVVRDQHSNAQGGKVGVIDEEDVEVVVDGDILEFTTDYNLQHG